MAIRTTATACVLLLVLGACTGTPVEQVGVELDDTTADVALPSTDDAPTGEADGDADAGETGDGEASSDGQSDEGADGDGRSAGDEGSGTGGDATTTSPTSPTPGATTAPGTPTPAPTTRTLREADLFDDTEKVVGISESEIYLCGHAALIFADAFDVRPEDLNVYWTVVNRQGGVHGRQVRLSWKDDQYSPDQAVRAAESCRSENPFLLLGGIGFDQIPAVRNWAERNRMLYLHHIAVAPSSQLRYSFSYQPTVDATGRAFGEHIARNHSDKPVGIIWRRSENWEPGHRLGRQTMDRLGVNVVADLPVSQNQGVYTQQIRELQVRGAEVVWLWENALVAAQVIRQADAQGYRPKWVVFPFQTTLDVVGNGSLNPTMEGVATWSAYAPGGYGNDFAEFGYTEEIRRFEAAYAEHRPRTTTNDLLWQVWLGNQALHRVLELCGPDCNRNRLAAIWLDGYRERMNPSCAVDFSRQGAFGGRIGGYQFYVHETFRHSSGQPWWRTTRWCSESLR